MNKPISVLYRSKYGGTWFFTCAFDNFNMPPIDNYNSVQASSHLIEIVISALESYGFQTQIKEFDLLKDAPEYFGFDS
jgi:hypothetical protein